MLINTNVILHDQYQLQRQLGKNAGRQTWLAQDLKENELVVVKLLSFGGDVQWDDLKLFEREAQVLQKLDRPDIPKYRDYFSIDDRSLWFGLVQEYISGESLQARLDQGDRFSVEQVYAIARAVLEILIYLHELSPPLLHRDIKPSNILLDDLDRLYLVDFGAVQDRAAVEGRTFTIVGTYGYAPIEQFGGRAVPASDLYALGGTLIHLLTGVSPANLPQKNMQVVFRDRASAPERFVRWIEVLTKPAIESRYQSAREALLLLDSSAISSAPTSPSATPKISTTSFPTPITLITLVRDDLAQTLTIDIPRHQGIIPAPNAGYCFFGVYILMLGILELAKSGFSILSSTTLVYWFIGFLLIYFAFKFPGRYHSASSFVVFNLNHFTIEQRAVNLGDLTAYEGKGRIRQIRRIYSIGDRPDRMAVVIESIGGVTHKIGYAIYSTASRNSPSGFSAVNILTAEEAMWIAASIKDWLQSVLNEKSKS